MADTLLHLPALHMVAGTSGTTYDDPATDMAGPDLVTQGLMYPSGTDRYARWFFMLPAEYDSGTDTTFRLVWTSGTTTTGNARWTLQTHWLRTGVEPITDPFDGTATTTDVATHGTSKYLRYTDISRTHAQMNSPGIHQPMHLQVEREGLHINDTLAEHSWLLWIEVSQ